MPEENTQIGFRINKIKDFAFFIDLDKFNPTPNKEVVVKFQHFTNFSPSNNTIRLVMRTYFLYAEDKEESKIIDIHVENIFELTDLKFFYKKEINQFILPKEIIIPMVSLSISHSRALLAKNLAGTEYQPYLIPIIDPVIITKDLFPYMFEAVKKLDNFPKVRKQVKSKKV